MSPTLTWSRGNVQHERQRRKGSKWIREEGRRMWAGGSRWRNWRISLESGKNEGTNENGRRVIIPPTSLPPWIDLAVYSIGHRHMYRIYTYRADRCWTGSDSDGVLSWSLVYEVFVQLRACLQPGGGAALERVHFAQHNLLSAQSHL